MSDDWQITVSCQGVAPKGFLSAWSPRGLYQCLTVKADRGPFGRNNVDSLLFEHEIKVAYVYGEDEKFINNPTYAKGKILGNWQLMVPGLSQEGQNAREAEIKSILLSHGAATREKLREIKGDIPLAKSAFLNKPCWVLFDPPIEGAADSYPERRYISNEEAQELISGVRPFPKDAWYQEKNKAKADHRAAQGENGSKAADLVRGSGGGHPSFTGGPPQGQTPVVQNGGSSFGQNGFGGSPAPTGGFGGFGATGATNGAGQAPAEAPKISFT